MRKLAPVLGLHEADLLAIAWMDLPEDLAPLDPRASWYLPYLAWHASRIQPEQVGELLSGNRNMGRRAAYAIMTVTGLGQAAPLPRHPPGTTEMAWLIWDVRRVTSDQVRHVRDLAKERARMASLSETP